MTSISNNQNNIIHTTDNLKLLATYLTKQFGKKKAQLLIEQYTNKSHKENHDYLFGANSLSYHLGERNIEWFSVYFLQDTFIPKPTNQARKLAPIHYEIWRELQSMFVDDTIDKLELVLPRGHAKTTVCDFAISVWSHCYQKSKYTLVAGKTEQDAVEFIRETRYALEENPYIIHAFGELINAKKHVVNKLELELTNKTKIQAISSTSSLRGKKFYGSRPSLIIADDYQGKSDVITQEARDKKYDTWQQDAQYAGDKAVYRDGKKIKSGTKFIVLGTILHRDCFISRLLKDKSYKHVVRKAVEVDNVDELFNSGHWAEFKKIYFDAKLSDPFSLAKEYYYQHEQEMQFPLLWSEKNTCLDLAIDYYSNPQAFKQEMQNDASKIGERAFHQIKTISREEIEQQEFVSTILCCDPAVETGKHNDYTALLVGSKTPNEFRWIRKGLLLKVKFDEYIDNVINLLKEYSDISHLWVEKNTYNGADVREMEKRIASDEELRKRSITILNERQNKNKENKIRAISAKVDSGFFIFPEEDMEFTDQILNYEGEGYSLHDDAPDVTAEFDRLIDEIYEEVGSIEFLPGNLLF